MSRDYNGRKWQAGERYVAFLKPGDVALDAPLVAVTELREVARLLHCKIVLKRMAIIVVGANLFDTLGVAAALAHRLDFRVSCGVAQGDCAEWPTPLLLEDVIGAAVTRAARCAGAHLVRTLDGDLWVAHSSIHAELEGGGVVLCDAVDIRKRETDPEVTPRARACRWPVMTPAISSASTTAVQRTTHHAYTLFADIARSEALSGNVDAYRDTLGSLRDAVKAHVPGALSLCDGLPSGLIADDLVSVADVLHFEFTGDGFELVVFSTKSPRQFLDWALTLAEELCLRSLPVRLTAAMGEVFREKVTLVHPDGTYSFTRLSGPVIDECQDGCSAPTGNNGAESIPSFRIMNSLSRDPRLPLAWQDGALWDELVFEGGASGRAARDLASVVVAFDREETRGRADRTFRDWRLWRRRYDESVPRNPLAHDAITASLWRITKLGYLHAALEAGVVGSIFVGLSGMPRNLPVAAGGALVLALTFAFIGGLHFERYLGLRVLPTLQRFHFDEPVRERVMRSTVRMRFAMEKESRSARRRGIVRECGWRGIWYWMWWWLRTQPPHKRRRFRRHLPGPQMFWPVVGLWIVGTAGYAAWAIIVAVLWCPVTGSGAIGPFTPSDQAIAAAIFLGFWWNLCLYLRLRRIGLAMLYLSNSGFRETGRRRLRNARAHDIATGLGLIGTTAWLAWLSGRSLRAGEHDIFVTSLVGLAFVLLLLPVSLTHFRLLARDAERWLDAAATGALKGNGKDLREVISLEPIRAAVRTMVMRGDILASAMLLMHKTIVGGKPIELSPHVLHERAAWFVIDQHGHVHLISGSCLRDLGWDAVKPSTVSELYAEGRFAAKVIRDLARLARPNQFVELDLVGAGPEIDGQLRIAPFKVFVRLLNAESMSAGYLALAIRQGRGHELAPANLKG